MTKHVQKSMLASHNAPLHGLKQRHYMW